jgi:hypothetical protein
LHQTLLEPALFMAVVVGVVIFLALRLVQVVLVGVVLVQTVPLV